MNDILFEYLHITLCFSYIYQFLTTILISNKNIFLIVVILYLRIRGNRYFLLRRTSAWKINP